MPACTNTAAPVPTGTVCTLTCASGYAPSAPSTTCINGAMDSTPSCQRECADWGVKSDKTTTVALPVEGKQQ